MKLPLDLKRTYEYRTLQEIAKGMCINKPMIEFSIFESFDNEEGVWMVSAPDIESTNAVIGGEVQFIADYWRVAEMPIYSCVVKDPTWRDIINIFNDMLQQGYGQGVYLEGLILNEPDDNIDTVRFQIGS
jgi:hypothetical protein